MHFICVDGSTALQFRLRILLEKNLGVASIKTSEEIVKLLTLGVLHRSRHEETLLIADQLLNQTVL